MYIGLLNSLKPAPYYPEIPEQINSNYVYFLFRKYTLRMRVGVGTRVSNNQWISRLMRKKRLKKNGTFNNFVKFPTNNIGKVLNTKTIFQKYFKIS